MKVHCLQVTQGPHVTQEKACYKQSKHKQKFIGTLSVTPASQTGPSVSNNERAKCRNSQLTWSDKGILKDREGDEVAPSFFELFSPRPGHHILCWHGYLPGILKHQHLS